MKDRIARARAALEQAKRKAEERVLEEAQKALVARMKAAARTALGDAETFLFGKEEPTPEGAAKATEEGPLAKARREADLRAEVRAATSERERPPKRDEPKPEPAKAPRATPKERTTATRSVSDDSAIDDELAAMKKRLGKK